MAEAALGRRLSGMAVHVLSSVSVCAMWHVCIHEVDDPEMRVSQRLMSIQMNELNVWGMYVHGVCVCVVVVCDLLCGWGDVHVDHVLT